MSSIIVPVFQPPLRHTNTVLTFHHCYISIGSRITRWHPLTTAYPSTAARMRLFRVVSQSRRHEWHRICLRATEIMPSVTQVKE